MSQKKKEAPVKEKKKKPQAKKSNTINVSKSVKIMATMGQLRGQNFRQTIRLLGEAEDEFKRNGRLILKGA